MKALSQFKTVWGACLGSLILVFCLIPLFAACCETGQSPSRQRAGGACEYKKYKGEAEIVSIAPKSDAPGEYEIQFSFHPQETIREKFARAEGRTWPLVQKDFSYPKEDFLVQYGIKVGKRFPCYLKAITKGTCSPVLFEFPTIDR